VSSDYLITNICSKPCKFILLELHRPVLHVCTEMFAYMHSLVYCNTQGVVARIGTEKKLLVILSFLHLP
jgi:hypothetical protein